MTDVGLSDLIERIKREGVEEAQQKSDEILAEARREADSILQIARTEAERTVGAAETRAEEIQENAQLAVRQTARDVELLLKERITGLFEHALMREVSHTLSPEFLSELVLRITSDWVRHPEVQVTVGEADRQKLQDLVLARVREELESPITIRVSDRIKKGFRIGLKGQHFYHDFTDEGISDVLKAFLTPSIRQMLDEEDG